MLGKMERDCLFRATVMAAVCILPVSVVFAGPSVLVSVQPVVLHESSGLDVVTGDLPAGAPSILVGTAFVVELWAQQVDPNLGGLQCVYSDLSFDGSVMTCVDTTPSGLFGVLATGECDPPGVDELGGCGFSVGVGITPEWVLVATVEMHANVESLGNVVVSAGARTSISISSYGNVPVDQIAFGSSAPFDIVSPEGEGACCHPDTCSDDLDASACIASSGRYLGDGTTCDGDPDGDGVVGCDDACPTTLAPAGVDGSGRPLGDLDEDCDVDLADFDILQENFSGPSG